MTTTSAALLPLLQQVLQDAGVASHVDGNALLLDSGLRLTPHAMAAHARENGGWQTSTVIEASIRSCSPMACSSTSMQWCR